MSKAQRAIKPPRIAGLKTGHPLVGSLVAGFLFNEFGGPKTWDVRRKYQADINGSSAGWKEFGVEGGHSAGDHIDTNIPFDDFYKAAGAVVFGWRCLGTVAQWDGPLGPNSGNAFQLLRGTSDTQLRLYIDGSYQNLNVTTNIFNGNYHIIGVHWSSNREVFVNGFSEASSTGANGSGSTNTLILTRAHPSAGYLQSIFDFCYVFDRELTDEEDLGLVNDPFSMFETAWSPGRFISVSAATIKTVSDTGGGSDAISQILASLGVSDSGGGTESLSGTTSLSVADTGGGTDTLAQLLASLGVSDVGAGADTISQILASLAVSDAGGGADQVTINVTLQGLRHRGWHRRGQRPDRNSQDGHGHGGRRRFGRLYLCQSLGPRRGHRGGYPDDIRDSGGF
jgi:hypothetical protein